MPSDTSITSPMPRRHALALPGRLLEVDGVRLSVADTGGPGLPLVCLHAAGHGSRDYEPLRQRIAPSIRVITLDWPGHGRSGPDHEHADARRYGRLLLGCADALQLERFVVLGCSVGGAAAIHLAARCPERISALVLCNAGGLAEPNALVRGFTRAMAWAYRRGAAGSWWFPWFFGLEYRALLHGSANDQRRRIVEAGREHAPVLAELWRSFGEAVNDVRDHIDAVKCPTWLAWARSDPFNNHRMVAASLRRFHAPLTLYPGGHAPFLEQPDAFARDLLRFLDDVPAGN